MIISQIDIFIYAFMILSYIAFLVVREDKGNLKNNKTFLYVISSTGLLLLLESWSWIFNGINGEPFATLNYAGNFLLFVFNFFPTTCWFMYLDEKIIGDPLIIRRRNRFYLLLNLTLAIVVFSNPWTNIMFSIKSGNIYERGIGVYVMGAVNLMLIPLYILFSRKHKRYIMGNVLQVILTLSILPIVGGFLQIMFYGITLIWPMLSLVAIFAYLLIEREELLKDSLTGLYTRSRLENRLNFKLKHNQAFTIMMIDMDDFKLINDRFGHDGGDEALKIVSNILKYSVKRCDSVYRYGGDEFIVLIESAQEDTGEIVVERLKSQIDIRNQSLEKRYDIDMSIGCQFIDEGETRNIFEILSDVDSRMYQEKMKHKALKKVSL